MDPSEPGAGFLRNVTAMFDLRDVSSDVNLVSAVWPMFVPRRCCHVLFLVAVSALLPVVTGMVSQWRCWYIRVKVTWY